MISYTKVLHSFPLTSELNAAACLPCPVRSLTLSGSLCISMKAEYSSIRSFDEAMVRSCHTGTAVADGAGGGASGS